MESSNKLFGYERYLTAVARRINKATLPAAIEGEIERELQEAFHEVLASGEPLPQEMAHALMKSFETILGGKSDPLFTPSRKPGHREHPWAKDYINDGIVYLKAVDDGLIDDKTAIKTVATAFSVDTSTVSKWKKRFEPNLSIYSAIQKHENFDNLVRVLMTASGRHYRELVRKRERAHPH